MEREMVDFHPKIVMIDDDSDDQYIFREIFKEYNEAIEFKGFLNGRDFFSYFDTQDKEKNVLPNIILLDLNLPRDDGFEILKLLKTNPILKNIPVIILTTSSSPIDIRDCYRFGAKSYFVKPMVLVEIRALVSTIYSQWFDQKLI